MKQFIVLTTVLVVICNQMLQGQLYTPNGIITGATNNAGVGIGMTKPKATLDIGGPLLLGDALRLRSGDTYSSEKNINQVLFSFLGTSSYSHAIKSRHNKAQSMGNAIDFYVWDHTVDRSSETGSKLVMTLNGGNVGIGVENPSAKLHIYEDAPNVSVKLQNDKDDFDIRLVNKGNGSRTRFFLENELKMELCRDCDGPRITSLLICEDLNVPYNYNILDLSYQKGISYLRGGSYKFSIRETGDATFAGKLTAREIEVKADVWADYVFDDDYELRNLAEVESFIERNKHLPDIPSGEEVEGNGLNLGEMEMMLLRKIEELTLYLIEQQKEIDRLKSKIVKLHN